MANSDCGNNTSILEIYNDSLLQEKYINWDYNKGLPSKPVCSKYFKPDYGILHFIYLKETPKAYQILIGFDEIKYLPKVKEYVTISWQDYILSSYGIKRLTVEDDKQVTEQAIKKSPSENSESINFPKGLELLCPMEIKGNWVKVQYDCFYNQEENKYEDQPCHDFIYKCKPAQTGWIKWRNKNKILIDIFLMP